ncbi:hypothetical protein HZA85_01900 [Candidatus Uhrbacteria bacterium]|nr:hypothetical protein [Candidatus Uhrbacteria bacterium]
MRNLFQIAVENLGIEKRRVDINGVTVTAIKGSPDNIARVIGTALREEQYDLSNLIGMGISRDGQIHLIGFDPDNGGKISKAELPENELGGLYLDGFDYAHFVGSMKDGIVVSAFAKGVQATPQKGQALDTFVKAVFADGNVIGAEDTTNTVLLIGRKGDRVLFALDTEKPDLFMQVTTPQMIGEPRYALVDQQTLLIAEAGTDQVYATTAQELKTLFETGVEPTWQMAALKGLRIEDISLGIGDTNTVIVTAIQGRQRKLIPTWAGWKPTNEGEQKFLMNPSYADGVESGTTAPIVRTTSSTYVAVDGNGGTFPRLTIGTPEDINHRLAVMVKKAETGGYANLAL